MVGLESTHSRAFSISWSAGTTSSTTPADLAFFGSFSLPSSSSGEADIAPSLRTSRVVPPAPGKMPTMISGRPIFALGLSAAKIRWQASGISSPMPSAVPGRAAAIGLPPLFLSSMPPRSILRRMACMPITPSKSPLAGSSPASSRILAMMLRSMPPAKDPSLPEVRITPLTVSSASASSISVSRSRKPCWFITFIDLPGTSQVMIATPSAPFSMVKSVICRSLPLHAFDDRGGTHAGGDAKRGKTHTRAAALQLIQKRADDDRARRPQRVTHGNGPAIDVELRVIDVKGLHEAQDDGGKRLVHLEEVDIRDRHAAVFQRLFGGGHRAGQHDGGIGADLGGLADAGARGQAPFLAERLTAHEHARRAVDDARGVACVVNVIDRLKVRVFQLRHGIETRHHLAHILETGLQGSERLHVGSRAHVFVMIEDRQAILVLDLDNRAIKAAVLPSGSGAALRFHGKRVCVVAGKPVFGGDDIG